MDKKDIYEHLAKIYLDTTPAVSSKKKTAATSKKRKKYYLFAAIPFAAGVFIFLLLVAFRGYGMPMASSSLVVSDMIKMSFNLDAARKQVYDLNLKNLNLNGYKSLVFTLRDSNYNDKLSFRVEFTNAFKERAEVYVKEISNKWKEYRLDLSGFKGISDWSDITQLSFVVEEWNTRDNKGILYIDNVRFLK